MFIEDYYNDIVNTISEKYLTAILAGEIFMETSLKKKMIGTVAEYGGVATGALVGAQLGTAVAGPVGTIGGALVGTMLEKVFVWAGEEINTRALSISENRKITTVYGLAEKRICNALDADLKLRSDSNFYSDMPDDRAPAAEILEGILFAAQRENEERKLPYLANLYANINFNENVSRPMANQLVTLAASVSYRQMTVLSVIGKCNEDILDISLRNTEFRGFVDYESTSIAAEIFDLYRMSLIISSEAILDASSFTPSLLKVNGVGDLLYRHMELSDMPLDDIMQSVIDFLTDNSPAPSRDDVVTGELNLITTETVDAIVEKRVSNLPIPQIETIDDGNGGITLSIK